MIELAFVVCLLRAPSLCEERYIAFLPEVSLMSCMIGAEPQLAEWIEAHPDRLIARWSCQPVGGLRA